MNGKRQKREREKRLLITREKKLLILSITFLNKLIYFKRERENTFLCVLLFKILTLTFFTFISQE